MPTRHLALILGLSWGAVSPPPASAGTGVFTLHWAAATQNPNFDRGKDVVVDASGSVYVAGFDSGADKGVLLKYSAGGGLVWSRLFSGGADYLALDPSGNVIVGGTFDASAGTSLDYSVVKYDASGNQLWLRRFDHNQDRDSLEAVAVDGLGNVYVTGMGDGSGPRNVYTLKYDPNGTQLWMAVYTRSDDLASDVAVHSDGSVYVLASTTGFGTDDDIVLIKYNSLGIEQWVGRYNGGGNGPGGDFTDDWPSRLALDAAGNAYVVGHSEPTNGGGYGVVTLKYAGDSTLVWARRYDPGGTSSGDLGQVLSGLAINGSGEVFVSGRISRADFDWVTIKYSASGTEVWAKEFNGPAGGADEPRDLIIDHEGDVVVLGRTQGGVVQLRRYALGDGALLWSETYNGAADGLGLAAKGTAFYAAGFTTALTPDGVTLKYSTDPTPPSLTIGDVSMPEGQSGDTSFAFTVSLSASSSNNVTVSYSTQNNTATAGTDYVPASGNLTFNPGDTSKTVTVVVTADATSENDEAFSLVLTNPDYATLSRDTASGVIVNDDGGSSLPLVTIDDAAIAEGNTAASILAFPVRLSSARATNITLVFGTSSGTATAGTDYTSRSGTFTVPAGAISKNLVFLVQGDTTVEPDETMSVTLDSPLTAVLLRSRATGTIQNDDPAPAATNLTQYRLYHDGTKEHLYTTDQNEYNVLGTRNWTQEGVAYRMLSNGTFAGAASVPFFRLYHPGILQHHWTTDSNEALVLSGNNAWFYEGTIGYLLAAQASGTTPLFRMALASPPLHLWTTDQNEYDTLATRGWTKEGIVGYVIP
jgi:hypothetical protein